MEWYYIALIVWFVGAIVADLLFIRKWKKGTFAKLYYSLVWPLLLPLYLIHVIYNYFKDKE